MGYAATELKITVLSGVSDTIKCYCVNILLRVGPGSNNRIRETVRSSRALSARAQELRCAFLLCLALPGPSLRFPFLLRAARPCPALPFPALLCPPLPCAALP